MHVSKPLDTKQLGKRLRQEREVRGLSLTDVAPACGLSHQYLSILEKGKVKQPSLSIVQAVLAYYGLTLDVCDISRRPSQIWTHRSIDEHHRAWRSSQQRPVDAGVA